jgi:hypothetical protein
VRSVYSEDSMSIITSVPFAARRTRSQFDRQTSSEMSRPSWVSLIEMLASSRPVASIRRSAAA